jgi:hypothetical protein
MSTKEFQYTDISVGDVVWFIDFRNEERRVRIIESIENIKNGRDGFCGEWLDEKRDYDSAEALNYCDKIQRIEPRQSNTAIV